MQDNGWKTAAGKLLSRATHALEHHPRQFTAALAALLLCGAGGAFAVAQSAGEIDPSTLPQRTVIESVQPLPVLEQAEALDAYRFNLFRTESVRSSDTVESLLARLGINDPAAAAFLRSDPTFRARVLAQPGRAVSVEGSDAHALMKLTVRWLSAQPGRFDRFVVLRDPDGGFVTRTVSAALSTSLHFASGAVCTTFFDAIDDAGLDEDVAKQVISIFEGDIDFHHGLRQGDRFNVIYEVLEADGEPMRTGRVISVEFANRGQVHQAMWFQSPGEPGGYFDLDGRSLERSYLASPMEVTRITSGFERRFHPVLHHWLKHEGIDYGGPVGTPVRTIGDGTVHWAGRMGSFGNLVVVDHGEGDETYYAHLSQVLVRQGQRVERGQFIGALGRTGRVTGPHLHFEFREKGQAKDPILALRNKEAPVLSAQAKAQFDRLSQSIRTQFAAANAATVASAN